jgi:hypothetical protein
MISIEEMSRVCAFEYLRSIQDGTVVLLHVAIQPRFGGFPSRSLVYVMKEGFHVRLFCYTSHFISPLTSSLYS